MPTALVIGVVDVVTGTISVAVVAVSIAFGHVWVEDYVFHRLLSCVEDVLHCEIIA
jgi:hypothetical protein